MTDTSSSSAGPTREEEGLTRDDICGVMEFGGDGTPCPKPPEGHGWCNAHHSRWYDHGYPQGAKAKHHWGEKQCETVLEDGTRCPNAWAKRGCCTEHFTNVKTRKATAPPPGVRCGYESCDVMVDASHTYCAEHTCMMQDCRKRRHKNNYCDQHARNIDKFGTPDPTVRHQALKPLSKVYVPARPIRERVDAAGSIPAILEEGLTRTEVDKYCARIRRGLEADRFSLDAADEIASAMGEHPSMVWGVAWARAQATMTPYAGGRV